MGTFRINPDLERDLFVSPELTQLVYDVGHRVFEEAELLATEEGSSYGFADSLSQHDHRSRSGRPVSTIASDDPGALSIEFGTRRTPRHRFLGRALDSIRR